MKKVIRLFLKIIFFPVPNFIVKSAAFQKLTPISEFFNTKAGFFTFLAGSGIVFFKIKNEEHGIAWKDIFIEGNGLIYDFIFFGVLLTLYEKFTENQRERIRLLDEIRDFRDWQSKEAMFRICGAIKRLNTLGVSAIDLQYCYLKGADLSNRRGVLISYNTETDFYRPTLEGKLKAANLSGSLLNGTNLSKANLSGVNLSGATIFANLSGANLDGAELSGAIVNKDWFEYLEKVKVIGREGILKNYELRKSNTFKNLYVLEKIKS